MSKKNKYVLNYADKSCKVFIMAQNIDAAKKLAYYFYPLSAGGWEISLYKKKAKTTVKTVTKPNKFK